MLRRWIHSERRVPGLPGNSALLEHASSWVDSRKAVNYSLIYTALHNVTRRTRVFPIDGLIKVELIDVPLQQILQVTLLLGCCMGRSALGIERLRVLFRFLLLLDSVHRLVSWARSSMNWLLVGGIVSGFL